MLQQKYVSLALLMLITAGNGAIQAGTLHQMSDEQLSETTGQALMSLSYIAPNDSANLESKRVGGDSNIGFYKLGLEAELELNANIKKLQLGCGGSNGTDSCDIDIDNLSLSGSGNTITSNNATAADRAARVTSDAKISNPFIQFAIKNPNSASTRSIVGIQLSAEKIVGLLTTGTINDSTSNGINKLSGYMHVQSASTSDTITGTVATAPGYFDASDPNNRISGTLDAPLGTKASFHLDSGGFWIPGFTNLNFSVPGVTLNGNRLSALALNTVVSLPDIILGRNSSNTNCGTLGTQSCNSYGATSGFVAGAQTVGGNTNTASDGNFGILSSSGGTVAGLSQGGVGSISSTGTTNYKDTLHSVVDSCSGIGCIIAGSGYYVNMYTAVRGVQAKVTVNQSLGLIHSLQINSATSLSLQQTALQWPGSNSDDVAQKGWWLSMKDPTYLGNIVPTNAVDLCQGGTSNASMCVYPQIATQVTSFLNANHPSTSDLGGLISGTSALGIQVGATGTGSGTGIGLSALNLNVNGLTLSNQFFAPNCYGSLKFC